MAAALSRACARVLYPALIGPNRPLGLSLSAGSRITLEGLNLTVVATVRVPVSMKFQTAKSCSPLSGGIC